MIDKLNENALIEIFKILPKSDFVSLSKVNKKFYEVSHRSSLLLTKANFFKAPPQEAYILGLENLLKNCWNISDDAFYGYGHTKKSRKELLQHYIIFQDRLNALQQFNSAQINKNISDFLHTNKATLSTIEKEIDWHSETAQLNRCRRS